MHLITLQWATGDVLHITNEVGSLETFQKLCILAVLTEYDATVSTTFESTNFSAWGLWSQLWISLLSYEYTNLTVYWSEVNRVH